jgi:hypothetical protein
VRRRYFSRLDLFALHELDHFAIRACDEGNAGFNRRLAQPDRARLNTARFRTGSQGAGISSIGVRRADAEVQKGGFSTLLVRATAATVGLNY